MAASIFKGQVGVTIRLNLGIDISAAGTAKIHWKKPSGAAGEWTAVKDNPAIGTITYTTVAASDLDESGIWYFNGEWNPDVPAADVHYGKTACLEILELFDCDQ